MTSEVTATLTAAKAGAAGRARPAAPAVGVPSAPPLPADLEALLRGLLGDAQRLAQLAPAHARAPSRVDPAMQGQPRLVGHDVPGQVAKAGRPCDLHPAPPLKAA